MSVGGYERSGRYKYIEVEIDSECVKSVLLPNIKCVTEVYNEDQEATVCISCIVNVVKETQLHSYRNNLPLHLALHYTARAVML
jgi:hypothetical protein